MLAKYTLEQECMTRRSEAEFETLKNLYNLQWLTNHVPLFPVACPIDPTLFPISLLLVSREF